MKRKSLSIKGNIFISIFALTILLLGALGILQAVFFDALFETARKQDVERASSLIVNSVNHEDSIDDFVNQVSSEYDVCVRVLNCQSYYSDFASSECQKGNCFLHHLPYDMNRYTSWLNYAQESTYTKDISKDDFDSYNLVDFSGEPTDTVISVALSTDTDGTLFLVIISSDIAPVQSTVNLFRILLGVISLFLLLTATIISLILSKRISSPIIGMKNNASKLAQSDYEVEFKEEGPQEIKELARTLNYTTAELGKVDSMRKELIANISHDLRTPLTMISGYAEMMRDIPSENTPENLQIIVDETSRLTSLVNDMLSVSRLQAGTQKMDIRRMNLTNAVFQTVERYAKFKEHNDFVINFEYENSVYIMADEIRLLQVIYNLINNAINYTGVDRTVTVTQTVEGDVVRISVTDTGDGIKEEDLPLIWDRYYKVDKIHRRAIVGTGLGLSIVKNILLLHGSRFGVSSEVHKGSTFWFEFKTVE